MIAFAAVCFLTAAVAWSRDCYWLLLLAPAVGAFSLGTAVTG